MFYYFAFFEDEIRYEIYHYSWMPWLMKKSFSFVTSPFKTLSTQTVFEIGFPAL